MFPRMIAFAAITAMSALAAFAQPLSSDEIEALVSGKRVLLATPFGLELPLRYNPDGNVTGDITGFQLAAMFTPRETGRWWVDGDQLCQQWPTWYDGETSCFAIQQTGENAISWTRDDGMTGTARIEG